jgi:hypothetical protein
MTHEWITDRLPTEADADGDGDVRVPRRPGQHSQRGHWWYQHYTLIVPGQPWWSEKAPVSVEVEPATMPAKPALALGQSWQRRNGSVVTIDEHDTGNTNYPFHAGNSWYCRDGTHCNGRAPLDLIELVSGPAPAPAPCLKSLTDDQLQAHFVAVQAETLRRVAARYIVEAKRPGGLLA